MTDKLYTLNELEVGSLYEAIHKGRYIKDPTRNIAIYSDIKHLFFKEWCVGDFDMYCPFVILQRTNDTKYEVIKVLTIEGLVGWLASSSIDRYWSSDNMQHQTMFRELK